MNTEPSAPIWVCVDCYLTHNGYTDEEMGIDPTRREYVPLSEIPDNVEVTVGMLAEYHECGEFNDITDNPYADAECDCERIEFTWSPCEGCGSHLGGSRDALTLWYPLAP